MLYDKGLLTGEELVSFRAYENKRNASYPTWTGCISARICSNCNHLISDSICLCNPIFICPNCQHKNGFCN